VLCWGPLIDAASALLERPEIAEKLHIVWIGGEAYPRGGEFNLSNDIHAANAVMRSQAAVQMVTAPGFRRAHVGFAELQRRVSGHGKIGEYLYRQLLEYLENREYPTVWQLGEGWRLGDSPSIGLLLNPHEYSREERPAPLFSPDMDYLPSPGLRPIEIYQDIDAGSCWRIFIASSN